ncbi:MAG TPA: response regulator transcription factor [Gemmatimonadales bacterium]|jgi:two-component system KDP operon response regulator KdpE|nr:response regulator transcription factor [Gemmatimonadales bacterium]
MPSSTILVIDDEPQIRRVVKNAFQAAGMKVLEAGTGRDGIDRVAAERPDLIILDLGLPDITGADVCREIRKWSPVPILVLSARHSDEEKVALLDLGADDYVTKPFSTPELEARGRALLRRIPAVGGSVVITIGDLVLDQTAHRVTRDGKALHLTRTEWELLRVLMSNAGRVLTHQQLFRDVWSGRAFGDAQQYLRVYVAHLRRKIEPDPVRPQYIHTEAGVGYRFATATEVLSRA